MSHIKFLLNIQKKKHLEIANIFRVKKINYVEIDSMWSVRLDESKDNSDDR